MKFVGGTYLRGMFYLGSVVLLWSCMSQTRVHVADVNPLGWEQEESIITLFPNRDTLSLYDLYVVVRYDKRAAGQEFPLTIATESPDSIRFQEPFMLRIPPRDLNRPFEHNSCFQEEELPYRNRVRLSQEGIYQFRFSHTRTESIEGITAIGIKALPNPGTSADSTHTTPNSKLL